MSSNRLSRAAIFAGAIAAPACWRGDAASTPQPPVTEQPARTGETGIVTGIVTDLRTKGPALRVGVTLRARDGSVHSALTDEKGRYTFADLPPGEYTLEWGAGVRKSIAVEAGHTVEANLAVMRPDIPVITPYGAPPARHRRV